jgi:hypothetical protein
VGAHRAERIRNEEAIRTYLAEQERIYKEGIEAALEEEEEQQFMEAMEKRAKHKEELLWAKRAKDAANSLARSRAIQVWLQLYGESTVVASFTRGVR